MKDLLEIMEGDSLEISASERTAGMQRLEEKIAKVIEFMNFRPSKRRYILESAAERQAFLQEGAETTSDFPSLFGTVLDRQLLAKYQIQKPDWRQYIKTGTQRDFRAANIIGVFGLQANLPQVPEQAEYKARALSDGLVPCTLKKYGALFPLSWEAIINDDLGAFSDAADRLANAALRTEYVAATKSFVAATGPSTSVFGATITHPIDSTAITNKGTSALTATTLFDTIVAMMNQYDTDGEPIMTSGFVLVVPPALWRAALEAVSPAALIATGLSSTSAKARDTSANVTSLLDVQIIVNSYLPIIDTSGHANTTWYVFAKLANGAAVQLNFLAGHTSPEICMKASDKVSLGGGLISSMEGDFHNDSAYWRVRHVLGSAVIDPRMAYAQVT